MIELVSLILSASVFWTAIELSILLLLLLLAVVGREVSLRGAIVQFVMAITVPAFFLWLVWGMPVGRTLRLYVKVPSITAYAFVSEAVEDPSTPQLVRVPMKGVRTILATVFLSDREERLVDERKDRSTVLNLLWRYVQAEVASALTSRENPTVKRRGTS